MSVGEGDASWLLLGSESEKELGPLWGSEEEKLGCRGSEWEVRITSESERGSRNHRLPPPALTERDQQSPDWGSEQGSWGPAGIPESEGRGCSPWPFREESGKGLPGAARGPGAEGTVGPREGARGIPATPRLARAAQGPHWGSDEGVVVRTVAQEVGTTSRRGSKSGWGPERAGCPFAIARLPPPGSQGRPGRARSRPGASLGPPTPGSRAGTPRALLPPRRAAPSSARPPNRRLRAPPPAGPAAPRTPGLAPSAAPCTLAGYFGLNP